MERTEEEYREIRRAINKRYRDSHKEQLKKYNDEWNASHRDWKLEYNRNRNRFADSPERYLKNRDKNIDYERGYRDKNREYARKYRATHRDEVRIQRHARRAKFREYNERRRAMKLSAPGRGITAEQWGQLKEEYHYMCVYCYKKEPEIELTLDHIEPLSKGGAHDIENATVACRSCNSSKRDKTLLQHLLFRLNESRKRT